MTNPPNPILVSSKEQTSHGTWKKNGIFASPSPKPGVLLVLALVVMLGCALPGVAAQPSKPSQPPAGKATQITPVRKASPTAKLQEKATPAAQAGKPTPVTPAILKKSLASAGPWLLLAAQDGLYAANTDGSGLTRMVEQPLAAPQHLKAAVSPSGGTIAFITATDLEHLQGLSLHLLTLPQRTAQTITALTSEKTTPGLELWRGDGGITNPVGEPVYEAARAITVMDSLAWSPDGRYLAFIGVMDGPSSDLYIYDMVNQEITRLSDEPSQAYQVSWSPDGQYIVNFGAETFGTGAGFAMVGAWATRPDGSEIKSLYVPDKESMGEELLGWIGDTTFAVQQWSGCPARNLRSVDISSAEVKTLFDNCYNSVAMQSQGDIMLAVPSDMQANYGVKPGIYYFQRGADKPERIFEGDARKVMFVPELYEYFVLTGDNQLLVFLGGQKAPPWVEKPDDFYGKGPFPLISSEATYWAKSTASGLQVRNGSADLIQVAPKMVSYMQWGIPPQDSGTDMERLFYSLEDEAAGQLYVANSPTFVPAMVPGSEKLKLVQQPVWVMP